MALKAHDLSLSSKGFEFENQYFFNSTKYWLGVPITIIYPRPMRYFKLKNSWKRIVRLSY